MKKEWDDIFNEFYLEHDKQISSGAFNGIILSKFKEWVIKNYNTPIPLTPTKKG